MTNHTPESPTPRKTIAELRTNVISLAPSDGDGSSWREFTEAVDELVARATAAEQMRAAAQELVAAEDEEKFFSTLRSASATDSANAATRARRAKQALRAALAATELGGTPAPSNAEAEWRACSTARDGWICIRREGHKGSHESINRMVWPNESCPICKGAGQVEGTAGVIIGGEAVPALMLCPECNSNARERLSAAVAPSNTEREAAVDAAIDRFEGTIGGDIVFDGHDEARAALRAMLLGPGGSSGSGAGGEVGVEGQP